MSALLSKPHEVAAAWRKRCCSVRMPASAVKVCWALLFGPSHGISYASQDRISDETGVDRGDVGKCLREFARIGLIEAVNAYDLAAALAADGQLKADARLVGYRRLLDPGVTITSDLAQSAKAGKALDPSDEIRIKPKKKGAFEPKIKGAGASHIEPEIEGAGASDFSIEHLETEREFTSQFEGPGASQFEGAGASPSRSQDLEEEGAHSAPPNIQSVDSSLEDHPMEQERALGALLTEDQLDLASSLFAKLSHRDVASLEDLARDLGPTKLTRHLVNLGQSQIDHPETVNITVTDWVQSMAKHRPMEGHHAA